MIRPAAKLPSSPNREALVSSNPNWPTVTPIRSRIWGARAMKDAVIAPLTKNWPATARSARRSRALNPGLRPAALAKKHVYLAQLFAPCDDRGGNSAGLRQRGRCALGHPHTIGGGDQLRS